MNHLLATLKRPFWIGPLVIFAFWWVAAAGQWISPKLLPDPISTIGVLWTSLVDGSIAGDFFGTLNRTLAAFGIAALLGVPIGIVLGSDPRIYGSMEFPIDFFRSTPATALFPLFLLISYRGCLPGWAPEVATVRCAAKASQAKRRARTSVPGLPT